MLHTPAPGTQEAVKSGRHCPVSRRQNWFGGQSESDVQPTSSMGTHVSTCSSHSSVSGSHGGGPHSQDCAKILHVSWPLQKRPSSQSVFTAQGSVGQGVGEGEAVGVGEGEPVGVGDGVPVGVGVAEPVGDGVGVGMTTPLQPHTINAPTIANRHPIWKMRWDNCRSP
jgi:hypothetical protein